MNTCEFCGASYSTATEGYQHVERADCRQRVNERARAIRAVVAAQWEVAITLEEMWCASVDPDSRSDFEMAGHYMCRDIATLRTAEQIVDGAA